MQETHSPDTLTLAEALLLLATEDIEGDVATRWGALDAGLAGAVLSDLALAGIIVPDASTLRLTGTNGTGTPSLDWALSRIANASPKNATHWVGALADEELRGLVIQEVIDKDIVRLDEDRVLWIIPRKRYPSVDTSAERSIRNEIRAVIIDGVAASPRLGALIGLLHASGLADLVFDRDERKRYRERIEEVARGTSFSDAVARVLKDAQDATNAAVMTAVLASTAAGSSAANG